MRERKRPRRKRDQRIPASRWAGQTLISTCVPMSGSGQKPTWPDVSGLSAFDLTRVASLGLTLSASKLWPSIGTKRTARMPGLRSSSLRPLQNFLRSRDGGRSRVRGISAGKWSTARRPCSRPYERPRLPAGYKFDGPSRIEAVVSVGFTGVPGSAFCTEAVRFESLGRDGQI